MTAKLAPELANWTDTGCPDGMHPSCLNCPLPKCRFELKQSPSEKQAAWKQEVIALQDLGLTIEQVSERLNVSVRTVYRRLS